MKYIEYVNETLYICGKYIKKSSEKFSQQSRDQSVFYRPECPKISKNYSFFSKKQVRLLYNIRLKSLFLGQNRSGQSSLTVFYESNTHTGNESPIEGSRGYQTYANVYSTDQSLN